jgi:hypothetical protein
MGRFFTRGGIFAALLVVAIATVVPLEMGTSHHSAKASHSGLVNATSWELTSVAESSPQSAFAVGYSSAPSTAPVALYWNGASFVATATPHPSGGAVLLSVTTIPGTKDAIAGGQSCTSSKCPGAFLLRWHDSSWTQMPVAPLSGSTAIEGVSASSPTDAWAVGQSCQNHKYTCNILTLHWNGIIWSKVSSVHMGKFYAYAYSTADISPTDVWVVGGSEFGAMALNWNGHAFVVVPVPDSGFGQALNIVAAIPGTKDVWTLESASGGQLPLMWNGRRWLPTPIPHEATGPLSDYTLETITASSPTDAWAAGTSYSNSGTVKTLMLHWNGIKWSHVTSPNPAPVNSLFGLSSVSKSSAFAVGSAASLFQASGSGLALQWNGKSWSKVKLPDPMVPSQATPRAGNLVQR